MVHMYASWLLTLIWRRSVFKMVCPDRYAFGETEANSPLCPAFSKLSAQDDSYQLHHVAASASTERN